MITHSPIKYRYSQKYRFTLVEDVFFYLDQDFPAVDRHLEFVDAKGNCWLQLEGRLYVVKAGYSWNGCSPRPLGKYGIWWLGTPDVQATIRASLAHDAGYQMMDCEDFPYTRAQIDRLFLKIMQAGGWPLARVYWAAVRVCGGIQHNLTK